MHAHTYLMDSDENILYESVSFDMGQSIKIFLVMVKNVFQSNFYSQPILEKVQQNLDANKDSLVYFGIDDMFYAWESCGECQLASMN